jgi:predicted O-methyltransferase YrrM
MTDSKHKISMTGVDSSAQCYTLNDAWIRATDGHSAGLYDFFIQLHTDILPEDFFIDKLVEILEREGADMLCAVAPIKSPQGLTSIALDVPMGDCDQQFRVKRFTMHEIMQQPPTFTDPKLLLNTGLMIADLSKPWTKSEDVYFSFTDRIIKYRGRREAAFEPEDWGFSRKARLAGAQKLVVTREIRLEHIGLAPYPNHVGWGSMQTDIGPVVPAPEFYAAAEAADKIPGYMLWEELAWLAELAKGKEVVEIGSWLGRSTKAIAATASKVYAVDSWRGTPNDLTGDQVKGGLEAYAEFCSNLAREINVGKVVAVPIDHAAEEFQNAAMWAEHSGHAWNPDMVFVDGANDLESVKRDIATALGMLKPGGIISGHDFAMESHPEVCKAVAELVPKAVVKAGTTIWYWQIENTLKLLP